MEMRLVLDILCFFNILFIIYIIPGESPHTSAHMGAETKLSVFAFSGQFSFAKNRRFPLLKSNFTFFGK